MAFIALYSDEKNKNIFSKKWLLLRYIVVKKIKIFLVKNGFYCVI